MFTDKGGHTGGGKGFAIGYANRAKVLPLDFKEEQR